MKFTVTRLCGGKALMAASSEMMDIDLESAAQKLSDDGFTKKKNEDNLMMILEWKGMEVTLYPQGKVMFYPLSEKDLAIEYATMILEKVR
jgi:hypothetical protein